MSLNRTVNQGVAVPRVARRALAAAGLAAALGGMVGCAPALDWREVAANQGPVMAMFPCKPHLQTREIALAGGPALLALQVCAAGDATWALASADLSDPARVGPALQQLRVAAAANLGADAARATALPLQVTGATPQPGSGRIALAGKRPDGQAAQSQVAVFAHGTRVFQATVLATRITSEAADNFFGALRVAQ